MKKAIRISNTLPNSFISFINPKKIQIVAEGNIYVYGSRLRAKCLIFENQASLRSFWLSVLGKSDLGKKCLGAVNALSIHIWDSKTKTNHIEYDPNYFAIIGLIKNHLTMEIITHEAVHAGFAYANRLGKRHKWPTTGDDYEFDNTDYQETICYPTGAIASNIARLARRYKLI